MDKGVMLIPETSEEIIRCKHWLIARGKEFIELFIPTVDGKKQLVIITAFNWVDNILYRLTFPVKREKMNVYN